MVDRAKYFNSNSPPNDDHFSFSDQLIIDRFFSGMNPTYEKRNPSYLSGKVKGFI